MFTVAASWAPFSLTLLAPHLLHRARARAPLRAWSYALRREVNDTGDEIGRGPPRVSSPRKLCPTSVGETTFFVYYAVVLHRDRAEFARARNRPPRNRRQRADDVVYDLFPYATRVNLGSSINLRGPPSIVVASRSCREINRPAAT